MAWRWRSALAAHVGYSMADWTYTPVYSHSIRQDPPKTLITRYEDGTEDRRQKHSNQTRHFTEQHVIDAVDMDAMVDFYETKGTLTSFSKVSYDPSEAPATEVTVRFVGPIVYAQIALDQFEATVQLVEVF